MKKNIILVFLIFFTSNVVLAEDIVYREFYFETGYKFYSVDGAVDLVNEYKASRSSPYFSLTYKDLSPNDKIMFDALINEKDNRNIDLHYIHKDLLNIEFSNRSLVHNLDHKLLLYHPEKYDLNPSTNYRLDFLKNYFSTKYKPFNYPFHLKLIIEDIERDGTVQKIFYGARSLDLNILSLPPNLRNNIFSRDRQIGFETERIIATIDGILGGVGLVFDLTSENFTNKHHNSLDYLLNYPTINKNAYELKLYSNLTGQLSWALALNRRDAKNHNRDEIGREGASVTQTDTVATVTYYPKKNLKFTLKVGYLDRDQDNPDTVRFLNNDIVGIKDAVSYSKKTADFSAWYEISSKAILKLNLKRKEIERSFNYFTLPEYSHTNTGVLSLEGRLNKNFSYKLIQKVENNHNPSYKKMPEMLYSTAVNLNYDFNIFSGIYLQSEYLMSENNSDIGYFRRSREHKHFLNCWINISDDLNLNLYGYYNSEKFISNIQYGSSNPTFFLDKDVPYSFTLYQTGLNISKIINKKHNLYGDVSYVRGYGTYYPHLFIGTVTNPGPPLVTYNFNTLGLDSLASTDFYQYGILLGNSYSIGKRSRVRLEASLKDHVDKTNYPKEGTVKMVFVSWEMKW
ncbi:MAG: hypothetical protein N2202_00295 [Proteobacteria bacterium]|nr:hypothetical protein [Pseudomonadota bacterium]